MTSEPTILFLGRRGRGRPRKFDEPATKWAGVALTPAQLADLEQVAADEGTTKAEVIRRAINELVGDYRERPVFPKT